MTDTPGPDATPETGGAAGSSPAAVPPSAAASPATEPGLADDLQTLAQDLRSPVMGAPAQRVTGMLIIALVVIALVIGFTALAKQGALTLDGATAPPSPSGAVVVLLA